MLEKCGGCEFFVLNLQNLKDSACHHGPPTPYPLMVMGMHPITKQPLPQVVGTLSMHPIRAPDDIGCGQFKRREMIHEHREMAEAS